MSTATRERRRRESGDLEQETRDGAPVFPQQAARAVEPSSAAEAVVPAVEPSSPAPVSLTAQAGGLYRELLQQRARGELTALDDRTLHILAGVGRSVAQLESDAAKLRERIQADEKLQRAAALQVAIDQTHKVLETAIADHAKIIEETSKLVQEKWIALKKAEGEAESLIGHQRALLQAGNTTLHATSRPAISGRIDILKKERHTKLLQLHATNPIAGKPGSERWNEINKRFGEKIAALERSITDPVLGLFLPDET